MYEHWAASNDCCGISAALTLPVAAAISVAVFTWERNMKEALKLFGTMTAIIFSVSVFHDLRPAATAATVATSDSTLTCVRGFCSTDDDCRCGPCVDGMCTEVTW